ISFTLADVTYEGYIPVNFVDISTQIHVGIGEYEPYFVTSNDEVDMHLVSYNTQIATITPEGKINFLKKGTVTIGAYDSTGNFDKVKYVVNKGEFPMPTDVKFTDIKSTSLVLDFIPSALSQNYEVIAVNSEGAVSHRDIATAAPYTVNVFNSVPDKTSVNRAKKSIKGTVTFHWSASDKNSKNRVYIRAVVDDSAAVKKYGPVISLTANSSIGGYEVYSYDSVTGEYTKIQTFAPSVTSYTVPKAQAADGIFAVRAFGTVQDETVYGDYSAMVDMKKIPEKVTGMALSDVKSTGYTLTWNEVSGAKYILYKYTDGEYKSFKTFSKPQYKATKLKASDYTKLKLVAYKTSDGISYESAYTDVFSVTTLPSQVKNFKISATDIGGKLKWTKVPSATGYDIYIYSSKKKKYVKHATAKKNSYQLTGRTPGKIYNVRIIPKIKTTYGTFYGEKTDLEFRTNPGKVTSVKASSTSTTGFTLTWNETKATSRYYVYQYSAKKKKYVKIAEVKNPTYTLKGLSTGKTYKFKIKTVKLSDGKILCSSTSDAFSFTTLPGKVTALKASSRKKTQFTVSWSEVSGAEAYQIFMYDKEKKDYVRIATVEGKTSYRVKGLKAGSSNKFRVRALKKLNGKNYYGQKSDVFTFTAKK
ncbi:MAG: fibronectin type III domain-containing protein, partial [Clostridia bacterium]|nr:fibronectin type III domain-containing protein [Clostridia bacterium]